MRVCSRSHSTCAFDPRLFASPWRAAAFDTAAPVPTGVQFASPDCRIALWLPLAPKAMQEDFPSRTGSPCQRTTYAG